MEMRVARLQKSAEKFSLSGSLTLLLDLRSTGVHALGGTGEGSVDELADARTGEGEALS